MTLFFRKHMKRTAIIIAVASMAMAALLLLLLRAPNPASGFRASKNLEIIMQSGREVSDTFDKYAKSGERDVVVAPTLDRTQDIAPLASLAQTITVRPFNADADAHHIRGFAEIDTAAFSLAYRIGSESNIAATYDSANSSLLFSYLPQRMSANNFEIPATPVTIETVSGIPSNTLVRVAGKVLRPTLSGNTFSYAEIADTPEVEIFTPDAESLLDEDSASFEKGMWQSQAGDCSNQLPGEPVISLATSTDASAGAYAAMISSRNHNACISKTFPVLLDPGKLYALSFDYKNVTGGDVRYYYKLRSKSHPQASFAFSESVPVEDSVWHSFETIIEPDKVKENFVAEDLAGEDAGGNSPAPDSGISEEIAGNFIHDMDFIDIYLYAPSDGSKEVTNIYDNVQLREYSFTSAHSIDLGKFIKKPLTIAENIRLREGDNTLSIVINKKSLIESETASFEQGAWKERVNDCSNQLPGDPDIGMQIVQDGTDGSQAVELSSRNHFACTSKTFPVNLSSGRQYKISFDYRNINGGEARYYYQLRSRDRKQTFSETISASDADWHSHEAVIIPEFEGIQSIDIYFYAPSSGSKEIVTRYDNVRLIEWLPKDLDSYHLFAEQAIDETSKIAAVEWKPVNRWKSKVVLHGVKSSFLLVYTEKYSAQWRAHLTSPLSRKKDSILPNSYQVPDAEINRQASRDEAREMFKSGLISRVGNKFISKNFDGSIRNDNVPNGKLWDSFSARTIHEAQHYQVNDYGNAWWIDPQALCVSKMNCMVNPDGTYEIALTVQNRILACAYVAIAAMVTLLITGTALLMKRTTQQNE